MDNVPLLVAKRRLCDYGQHVLAQTFINIGWHSLVGGRDISVSGS